MAGAHSGHTWLAHMVASASAVSSFRQYCTNVVKGMRAEPGCYDSAVIWDHILMRNIPKRNRP
eukprot:2959628-Pyramimonas_sp.AAC.1